MYTKRQPKPQAAISEAIVPTFVAISVLGTNINSKIFWDHTLGVRSIFFLSIEITEGQANTTTLIICSIENPPQRLKKNTAYSCPP